MDRPKSLAHFAVRKNKFAPGSSSEESDQEPTVDSERSASPKVLETSIRLHQIHASINLVRESLLRKKEKRVKLRSEIGNLQEKQDKNEEAFAVLKDAHRLSKKNESIREMLKRKGTALLTDIARLKEKLSDKTEMYEKAAEKRKALACAKGNGLNSLSLREVQTLAQNALETVQRVQAALREKCEKSQELDICGVCLTRYKSEITLPCGHFVLCLGCLSACEKCPVCRARIESSYSVVG